MENKVDIELAHDKNQINMFTANDMEEMTVEQAESLKERLTVAIEVLKNRKTLPSPAPISFGDMGLVTSKKLEAFAEVGRPTLKTEARGEPGEAYMHIVGYELDLDGAKKLNRWLLGAIDYIENGDPGGELCVKEKEK